MRAEKRHHFVASFDQVQVDCCAGTAAVEDVGRHHSRKIHARHAIDALAVIRRKDANVATMLAER